MESVMWFVIIKDFLVSVFSKLGISGTAIIILLAVCYFQHSTIQKQYTKIDGLNIIIKEQNDAIAELGKQRNELKTALDKKISENAKLTVDFNNWKSKIIKTPVAKTCEDAISEVRKTAADIASKWNKK